MNLCTHSKLYFASVIKNDKLAPSRKGDYYRYLAEFKTGNERNEAADQSLKAYQVCFASLHSSKFIKSPQD